MDKLEPQQPEGELVDCPKFDTCDYKTCVSCKVYDAIKAQRAFDLATMVKLPSEEELTAWFARMTSELYCQELARKLLKWLKEQKP